MTTRLTDRPAAAADVLRAGGVVAFPTETVYGLGADAFQPDAVRAVFAAKGRPADNPLIVHVAHPDQIDAVASVRSPVAQRLIEAFFPGPLTLVLPRRAEVPGVVTGGLDTVGVRMPAHPVARAFLTACATPVAAPSANRSGRPSPTTWEAVRADLDGRIPCILRGPRAEVGLESTVVLCRDAAPLVLRAGAVTLDALRQVVPTTRLADAAEDARRHSPGTRYRHYAPDARVVLVDAPEDAEPDPAHAYIGLGAPPRAARFGLVAVCPDVGAYAHELFDFFRRCDAAGLRRICCQRVPPEGLGLALLDRLERAAAG